MPFRGFRLQFLGCARFRDLGSTGCRNVGESRNRHHKKKKRCKDSNGFHGFSFCKADHD